MYQLHYFPANANARSNIAKLLDQVTVLPSVRRAYEREGITDDIC
jgi:glutathione S-transferase